MKRLLSICLSVVLIFSSAISVFAIGTDSLKETESKSIFPIKDGLAIVEKCEDYSYAILTGDSQNLVSISVTYSNDPATIYQWIIEYYNLENYEENLCEFVNDLIQYADSHKELASIVHFTEEETEVRENVLMPRSSAGADLFEELEELEGAEYSGSYLTQSTLNGNVYRVYSNHLFRVIQSTTISWNTSITVSSLILNYLNKVVNSALIEAICCALDVASAASTIIPAGGLNTYIARAQNARYVTVNGSAYAYNITYQFVDYDAYEDSNHNSHQRAYIARNSRTVQYSESDNYYHSLASQINDAKNMFNRIGQRP